MHPFNPYFYTVPSSGHRDTLTSQSPRTSDAANSASSERNDFEDEEEVYDEDEIQMIDGMLGGCLQSMGNISVRGTGTNGKQGIGRLLGVNDHWSSYEALLIIHSNYAYHS